jgi:ribosomal 50S subunit-recycling heat shock protein
MKVFQGTVAQLLTHLGQTTSVSEGRRVVVQGAVKINGKIVEDLTQVFDFKSSDTVQVGHQIPIFVGSKLPLSTGIQ